MAASVEFTYRLTKEEIVRAMKKSGYYKTSGVRLLVESAILGALAVYFLLSYFLAGYNSFNLGMAAVAAAFFVVILVVPNIDMNNKAKAVEQSGELWLKVSPQKLTLRDGNDEWVILLNGTANCKIVDERLIAVTTKEKQLMIIPIDKIPRDRSSEVQAMIYEGVLL